MGWIWTWTICPPRWTVALRLSSRDNLSPRRSLLRAPRPASISTWGANVVGADEPTATEEMRPLDPQTMTEVGTKLDLARAYIDMGDPDGARGILEEVMSEGDSEQKQEAKTLIGAL